MIQNHTLFHKRVRFFYYSLMTDCLNYAKLILEIPIWNSSAHLFDVMSLTQTVYYGLHRQPIPLHPMQKHQ
jgi:hypothetical protein